VRSLWVTDPWDTLDHPRDTTLRLVQEALRADQRCSWCGPAGLRLEGGRVLARCREVRGVPPGREGAGWALETAADLELSAFDLALYRVDPPVDRRYLEHLQLLAWAEEAGGPEVVNPPDLLMRWGDKLGPPALAAALPPTLVSSSWERLLDFGRAEGRVVLKPLGGAQSRGVQLLAFETPAEVERSRREIEALSGGLARPVLLQRYLPEVLDGEKRLWFVDGELLAQVKKRPPAGTFVIDMDKGSACLACDLTLAETRLAAAMGGALRSAGVRLAAVDVIAGHVTDWNLTSPGMLPTMERVLDRNLAAPVIRALARRERPARAVG
jgi:glutathione synthase